MGWDYEPISVAESVVLSAKIVGVSVALSADLDGPLSASVISSVRLSADIYQTATLSARLPGFDLPDHDYLGISYTSGDLTQVIYKTGGATGVTVATLTLAYDTPGGNLISVVKT